MLYFLKKRIGRLVRKGINVCTHKDSSLLTFIPHGGCEKDGYNFLNFKSDSALTLFNYIVNQYGDKYKYQIAVGESEKARLQNAVKESYPELSINMISHPSICKSSFTVCKEISKSRYIFTSQAYPFDYITRTQNLYYLGYYSGNFKNDFISTYNELQNKYKKAYKEFFSPSLLFSQLNSIVYNIPLENFSITGLVRNDNLFKPYNCPELDNWIKSSVNYSVEKVFLYTPTHRDYEEHSTQKRSLLGFDIDRESLERFLKDNKAIIIIKLHAHQNIEALKSELPHGVILHKSSNVYGLNELLQRADYLISDYSSTYYDYLLLDRPVLFNFYDFNIYKETRGFSFDPIDSIIAGESFTDQESMIEKMNKVIREDFYIEKRRFVRDLLFKYKDDKAAERVYNHVFNVKKTSN